MKNQGFLAADPLGKVGDWLKPNVLKVGIVGHCSKFPDGHLKSIRAPHARSVSVGKIGQAVIGAVPKIPALVLDLPLQLLHDVSVVLLCSHSRNKQHCHYNSGYHYIQQ